MRVWLICYAGFSGQDMRVGATLVIAEDVTRARAAGETAAAATLQGTMVDRIEVLAITPWQSPATLADADGHRYLVKTTLLRVF